MSVDALRDHFLRTKKNELTACENSRKRKLRELYAVSTDLGPDQWISLQFDAPYPPGELRFLSDNDITKGHYFQESTLPVPAKWAKLSIHKSPGPSTRFSRSPAARSPQPRPATLQDAVPSPATLLPKDIVADQTPTQQLSRHEVDAAQNAEQISSQDSLESLVPTVQNQANARTAEQSAASPGVDPRSAVAPTSEDVAVLPDTVDVQPPSNDTPPRPKIIHLPPKEAQERHLQEIEQGQENARARERKEDGKLLATSTSATMDDMPSSPSSTAGPFSVNTPMPNQHSPDTSPEGDNPTDAVSLRTPVSMGATKQEQSEKEEHDRVQEIQQDIARQEARGESATTADAQLRFEEQQAMQQTRDGTELASSGMQSSSSDGKLTDKASTLVKDVIAADREDKGTIADAEFTKAQPLPMRDDSGRNAEEQDDINKRDNTLRADASANDMQAHQESAPKTTSPSRPSPIDTSLIDVPMPDVISSPNFDNEETTSQKRPLPTPSQAAPERSTTRLSSGAIRHKSVSEILGETPKLSSPSIDKTPTVPNFTEQPLTSSPTTAVPLTPSVLATLSNNQMRTGDRKHKGRSKPSAIVFKKPENVASVAIHGDYSELAGVSKDDRKDYYQTMFVSQAFSPPRAQHLSEVLASASKVLTTSNRYTEVREHLDNRILKRVYQLQNANKWSLRQLERAPEPSRPPTHLDHLLREMKWMRTDFKEERKWKITTARNLVHWCAEWVAADTDRRFDLQVKVKTPPHKCESGGHVLSQASGTSSEPNKSHNNPRESSVAIDGDFDSEDVHRESSIQSTVAPAAVFSLGLDDCIFSMPETEMGSKLISELPTFQRLLDAPFAKSFHLSLQTSILPVSKYVHGRVIAMSTAFPRKRSRYDYEPEDESAHVGSKHRKLRDATGGSIASTGLLPEKTDVALFYSENKGLRDRLHAGHAFRPPSEFPMPATSFYENRASSQWLWDEDQKLRALVKDYTYNWSLISEALSMSNLYTASPERRTPWECFERWVQLEGLPAEMSKMQYFRTYQSRLEAAQRTVTAHQQAQQQLLAQQGNAAGVQTPLRRRTTVPIRVERRRGGKYLSIMEAMRKLARKREALAHKQQEAAKAAALRKHHEAPPPKAGVHTPQEFSNLKHEQEVKLQKRQELYRQQIAASQRQAALQQRAAQQGNAQQSLPNGVGPQQRTNSNPNGSATNLAPPPNPHTQQAMSMQRQQMLQQGMQNNMPNGNLGVPNMGMQGMPQAPMQMHMQGHQRIPSHQSPDNMRALLARQSQQNTYQNPNPNSSQYQMQQNNPTQLAAAHMMPANSGLQNQQMLAAAMHNANQNLNVNGSPANGIVNPADNSGSPPRNRSMNPSPQQPQTLSSGHVPAINDLTQKLKNQNPNMSDQEASRLAMEQLKEKMASQKFQQQRQNALNAAVGASGANFAHQQAQQALQSSQNQAAAQQHQQHQHQQGQQMQNAHAHAQNTTNGMTWSSPSQSHPQPHGHGHAHLTPASSSQGGPSATSPPLTHPSPHLQPANLNTYQQQLSAQLNTQQQRTLLLQQQQQQQQQRGMHSGSPANVGGAAVMGTPMSGMPGMGGMAGLGGMGSPAPMGMGSPAPMVAGGGGMLRPPSAGAGAAGSRSATPMQRPGTAGAE
ncbi:MAG: hypothetical protein Q9165_001603 [Trypethelium subeluteriae]